MKCLLWWCYITFVCVCGEGVCNERNVTVVCGNDMGCSCVVKEHVEYHVMNEQMMVSYALLKEMKMELKG